MIVEQNVGDFMATAPGMSASLAIGAPSASSLSPVIEETAAIEVIVETWAIREIWERSDSVILCHHSPSRSLHSDCRIRRDRPRPPAAAILEVFLGILP